MKNVIMPLLASAAFLALPVQAQDVEVTAEAAGIQTVAELRVADLGKPAGQEKAEQVMDTTIPAWCGPPVPMTDTVMYC